MTSDTLHLDARAIESANNQSHFDAGSGIARDAQAEYSNGLEVFGHQQDWTDEQKEYADQRATEWHGLVSKAYNERLQRRASWVPVSVAGPSNYPADKMRRRMEKELSTSQEWSEKMERFLNNTKTGIRALTPIDKQIEYYRSGRWNDVISSDDPHALEKLQARLAHLAELQDDMKKINAYYRKHDSAKGCPGVSDETAEKLDHYTAHGPAFAQGCPYPSFTLQNSNANMKRIKDRIAYLEKLQALAANTEAETKTEYNGFRIEQNAEEYRIRIIFDEKPDEQTRATLKSHGFKWSPKSSAWQRHLNGNGLYAARRVAEILAPEGNKPYAAQEPEEISLDEFIERVG